MDSFSRIISKLQWDGFLTSPHFKPEHVVVKEKLQQKSCLLFEVLTVNTSKAQPIIISLGWTVVPLFEGDREVVSGSFQVPLFGGVVDPKIIEDMKIRAPWDVVAEKMADKKNPLKFKEFVSILIRVDKADNLVRKIN